MKPLVIHPHLHGRRTGVTSHVEAVVPALAEQGLEVATVGRSLQETLPRWSWREVFRRVRAQPAVWHAHRNNELLAGLLLRLFARDLKVVFTRHSATRPGGYTRFLARHADRLIGLTAEVAGQLPSGARVIGHGVDLQRFAPPVDRSQAYRSLGVPGTHGLGVIARIRPEKGQRDFVDAVAPLLPQLPEWHAVLVGRAMPTEARFAEGLRKELGDRATFPGEERDVRRWYQGLSILVQPSRSEGFSLVVLEAMASGCCVVAAHLPHFGAIIEDGVSGFLYPPGDVEALRGILSELMRDPARAHAVGQAAAARARERFGVAQEARALKAVYRELVP